jgi:hypothetical protein
MKLNGLTPKKSEHEILEALTESTCKNNVLGLFIDGEDEMITTAVLKITDAVEQDKLVYFEKTDLHGYVLEMNPILLSKIKSVIPFNTLFNDPIYVRIRSMKEAKSDHLAA